jgi:hypothetical protein
VAADPAIEPLAIDLAALFDEAFGDMEPGDD